MKKQRVTIGDVAERAGVSKQTVSRAINDKGEIKPETKEKILTVVRELGYRPNRLAQAMSTNRTYMIGLVIPDITNPFFPEVAKGVHDAAFANNYNVFLCNTDDQSRLEMESLELLAAQGVDGIINFSHQADEEALLRFADGFRPIMLINREITHPHIDLMLVDNAHGASLAITYLIEQGHTQIGMITNNRFSLSLTKRVQGYRETMEKHGLGVEEGWISAETANLTGGYQATQRLLATHPDLTALFTYNDVMGLGAIRACLDAGLAIPQDTAIIGFDDIQLAAMNYPSLSTVRVDKYNIGYQAFTRLLERINQPDTPQTVIELPTQLILRESTKQVPLPFAFINT